MAGAVYSNLKPLHYPAALQAIAENRPAPPVHVRIKPTNVCNHSCYFCAYRTDNVSLGGGMVERDRIAPEKMREIVEDLIEMGVKAVTFSGGGEPLIYPQIAETVIRLAEGGIRVGTLTNGSRLKGKVADAFAAHGTWVRVSIDGWDGPSYARYRNVKESEFDGVMANLEAFAARGASCVLGASIIVDESNAGHILALCRRLADAGVRSIKISPCIVKDSGAANNAYHAPFRDLVAAQIARAQQDLAGPGLEIVNHYHDLDDRFDKPYGTCPFSRLLTVIGADGTVYTCQDKAYTAGGALGSIKERRFKDFWLSAENSRALAAIEPARHCRHHCVADAKNRLIHDFLSLDPDHTPFV